MRKVFHHRNTLRSAFEKRVYRSKGKGRGKRIKWVRR